MAAGTAVAQIQSSKSTPLPGGKVLVHGVANFSTTNFGLTSNFDLSSVLESIDALIVHINQSGQYNLMEGRVSGSWSTGVAAVTARFMDNAAVCDGGTNLSAVKFDFIAVGDQKVS